MSHEEVRALLPRYAAGVLDDAEATLVRAHVAAGCTDCLDEVFSHPVGLPPVPPPRVEAAPVRPLPAPRPARFLPLVLAFVLLSAAVVASVVGLDLHPRHDAGDPRVAQARELSQLRRERAQLTAHLADLERTAAEAEGASRDAAEARAATAEVRGDLRSAQLRIRSLKQAIRRQELDFRQKQQSMEAVIARLSPRATMPAAGTQAVRRSGCGRLPEPARGVCTSFCDVQRCDHSAGATCEALRARFQALTGARTPPCVVAVASGRLGTPCDESHLDLWSFATREGRLYTVTADTVDAATAADLCLAGSCRGLDPFGGNDEVPCHGAPGFACPRATFVAVADGTCVVAVSVCSPRCADQRTASYEITVEGAESIAQLADDVSSVPGEVDEVR